MRKVFIILFAVSTIGSTKILEVGSEKQFTNLRQAAQNAQPGDTLLFYPGIYSGGQAIANLQGSESNEITIMVQEKNSVIIRGGSTAWQLTDAAYVRISGFVFENQTANGVNFDDGGEYSTPAHHITFENCTFKDINATGNNDLLKLSGVDDFVVRNCTFQNGSPNGSGIDMVVGPVKDAPHIDSRPRVLGKHATSDQFVGRFGDDLKILWIEVVRSNRFLVNVNAAAASRTPHNSTEQKRHAQEHHYAFHLKPPL